MVRYKTKKGDHLFLPLPFTYNIVLKQYTYKVYTMFCIKQIKSE
jgi:hypothetical protein